MGLKEVFVAIESMGVVNVVIPFVMVFIILFAVFEKIRLFKERKVHAVLSFIFAFMVVAAADVVRSINLFSYYLVLLIFGAIVLLLFAGVFGGIPDIMNEKRKKYTAVIFIILVFIVVFYGLYASGIKFNLGPVSYEWLQTLVPIIFGILIFVLIVWLITRKGTTPPPGPGPEPRPPAPPRDYPYPYPRPS